MLLGITILGILVALWFASSLYPIVRHGISFKQGLLYAPLQMLYGLDDRQISIARKCKTPVIYVILHRSAIDPAVMLTLLPDTTLHILDERSAAAAWLEPYRSLAPTIAFNAKHIFVSRRLVRRLKGGGRLAVYIPDDVEPSQKGFRLYRAIARIASQANARIVPIDLVGARHLRVSRTPAAKAARHRFPVLSIRALEGRTIAELVEQAGENRTTRAHALFDRVAELRLLAANPERSLFRALSDAARLHGKRRIVLEDAQTGQWSYRRLFTEARIIGRNIQGKTVSASEPVGLLLPGSAFMVAAFLATQSAGRPAALIDPDAPLDATTAFLRTAGVRIVLTTRAIVAQEEVKALADAIEADGIRLVWLDEVLAQAGRAGRLAARLFWRFALHRRRPDDPAVLLAGAMEPGQAEVLVLSQRNILTNILQLQSRIDISPADTVINLLPAHYGAGLAGGTLLALMAGARLRSASNGSQAKTRSASGNRPTVLLGSETRLVQLLQAGETDLTQLRMIFAGAEPVSAETRRLFRERLGLEILEGYAFGNAAPIVALNTITHSREGTVGRLLPGIQLRLESVEGMEGAFRLHLRGPSLIHGRIREDRPGELQRFEEWLDTGDIVSIDREGFLALRQLDELNAAARGDAVTAA